MSSFKRIQEKKRIMERQVLKELFTGISKELRIGNFGPTASLSLPSQHGPCALLLLPMKT